MENDGVKPGVFKRILNQLRSQSKIILKYRTLETNRGSDSRVRRMWLQANQAVEHDARSG